MFTWLKRPPQQAPHSDSEQLLFSGALRHDKAWAQYENPLLRLSFWAMAKQFPTMMTSVARAAWREDPRALLVLRAAELGIGLMRAFTLVATNQILISIFSTGPTTDRMLSAAPALVGAAAVTTASSILSALSVAASGRLEPKIERACTARYYRGIARVELATLVDKEAQRALDAGRYGIRSVRAMLSSSIQVINTVIGLVAAAGVLLLLHPVLILALLLIAETDTVLTFDHTRPSHPVHIAVAPEGHTSSLVDLGNGGPQVLGNVMAVIRQVAASVLAQHSAASIVTNVGDYQDPPHLHFHVIHRGNPAQQQGRHQ